MQLKDHGKTLTGPVCFARLRGIQNHNVARYNSLFVSRNSTVLLAQLTTFLPIRQRNCLARTPLTWCSWTCLASSQTPTTTKTILSYCRSARTKMPFRKHSRKKTDTYKKWRHGIGEKLWNSKEKLRS